MNTELRERLTELAKQPLSVRAIAPLVGVSPQRVARLITSMGLRRQRKVQRHVPKVLVAIAKRMPTACVAKTVCQQVHCTLSVLAAALRELGIDGPATFLANRRRRTAGITLASTRVAEALRDYQERTGHSRKQIGNAIGTTVNTLHYWCHGKHLPKDIYWRDIATLTRRSQRFLFGSLRLAPMKPIAR